jgi:hypothetical protein
MVAHLGNVATSLSHNFRLISECCTMDGETVCECYRSDPSTLLCRRCFCLKLGCHNGLPRDFSFIDFSLTAASFVPRLKSTPSRARRLRWIPRPASCKLNTCRQGADSIRKQERISNAQAHISTQPPPPREDTRLSRPHEDQERSCRVEPSPRRWSQACGRQRRIPRLSPADCLGPEFMHALAIPARLPPAIP